MNRNCSVKKFLVWVMVVVGLLIFSGCRFPWPPQKEDAVSQPSPAALKLYRQAVSAYQAGEYTVAEKRFVDLRRRTMDKGLARMSLYGLACTRLMLANTPQEYQDALALWENWVQLTQTDYRRECPILLDPLIHKKMLFSNIPLTAAANGEKESSPKVDKWLVINAAKELDRLKIKLKATEKTSQTRKKRIGALEKQIAKLKRQFKALETIDQKIQKKKSAIPSADAPPQP